MLRLAFRLVHLRLHLRRVMLRVALPSSVVMCSRYVNTDVPGVLSIFRLQLFLSIVHADPRRAAGKMGQQGEGRLLSDCSRQGREVSG